MFLCAVGRCITTRFGIISIIKRLVSKKIYGIDLQSTIQVNVAIIALISRGLGAKSTVNIQNIYVHEIEGGGGG